MRISKFILICALAFTTAPMFAQDDKRVKDGNSAIPEPISNVDSLKHKGGTQDKISRLFPSKKEVKTSVTESPTDDGQKEVDKLRDSLSYLTVILNDKISEQAKLREEIDSIKSTNIILRDSLSVILAALEKSNTEIKEKDAEVLTLKTNMKERLAAVEFAVVRFGYSRLKDPYDKENINKAIKDIENIYTEDIRGENLDIVELLKKYENYSNEVREIIFEAQNDPDRKNFVFAEQYKDKYIGKLKNSFYYRDYYSKKVPTSKYLNDLIDDVIKVLLQHTSDNQVDLSSFL